MTTKPFEFAGTVSHGTMREQDLIEPFMEVLRKLDPETAADMEDDARRYLNALDGTYDKDPEYTDAEVEELREQYAGWFMADLFDALDGSAPEGWSFGAHEGDGSDYGFWWGEDEPEDEV